MAQPVEPAPGRLVCGLLAPAPDLLDAGERALESEFAPVELRSKDIPFDFTDYYEPEMGPGLLRRWVCVRGRFVPDRLAALKLQTNRLEARFLRQRKRQVNIDPGILTLANLVLASAKDFGHRIYLGSGIHAEVTLLFRDGEFRPLEWTYPDYKTAACFEFLNRCRQTLLDR